MVSSHRNNICTHKLVYLNQLVNYPILPRAATEIRVRVFISLTLNMCILPIKQTHYKQTNIKHNIKTYDRRYILLNESSNLTAKTQHPCSTININGILGLLQLVLNTRALHR